MSTRKILKADVVFYPPEKGGRGSMPAPDYRPHFATKGDEMLGVRILNFSQNSKLGEATEIIFELVYDGVDYSSLRLGAKFNIVEGSKVVGSGLVTE